MFLGHFLPAEAEDPAAGTRSKRYLGLEEGRVSAEGSGQDVVVDLVTKIPAEDAEVICKVREERQGPPRSGQMRPFCQTPNRPPSQGRRSNTRSTRFSQTRTGGNGRVLLETLGSSVHELQASMQPLPGA